MFCDTCEHYTWERVPVNPFDDPKGKEYGFTSTQMCTAEPEDDCPASEAMEHYYEEWMTCEVCGRTIPQNTDCAACLEIEIMATTWAAEVHEWVAWFLANS